MPLFECNNCQCKAIENTGHTNFWMNKAKQQPVFCSACEGIYKDTADDLKPALLAEGFSPDLAKWHGKFPKQTASEGGCIVDKLGYAHEKPLPKKPRSSRGASGLTL